METASLVALLTLIGCNPNGPAAPDLTSVETPPSATLEVAPETVPERPPARLCSDPEAFDQLVELPDEPRPLELRGGRTQAFPLASSRDETLEIVAHQDGIDVYLALFDPDTGARLVATDRPTARLGEERLLWVTEADRPLRLHVCAWGEDTISGTYTLSVQRRAIEPDDRVTVTATQNLEEAKRLVRLGPSRWDDGLALFATAVQEADTETGRFVWTEALYRQARTLQRQQRFEEALEPLDVLSETHDHQGFPEMAIRILYRRANSQRALLRFEEAGRNFPRAHRIAEESGSRQLLATVSLEHGHFLQGRDQFSRAIQAYDSALDLWRELEDPLRSGMTLYSRGHAYQRLGKSPEALDDFLEAFSTFESQDSDPNRLAETLFRMHEAYSGLQRMSEAERALRDSLEIVEATGNLRLRSDALVSLVAALNDQRRYDEALEVSREAHDSMPGFATAVDRAVLLHNTGVSYEGLQVYDKALEHYSGALDRFVQAGDLRASSITRLAIAQVRRKQGQPDLALESILQGIREVESLRSAVDSYDLRASYLATERFQYEFLIDLLMELDRQRPNLGYQERALAVSERSRARSQVDALKDRNRSRSRDRAPEDLETERLAAEIRQLEMERSRLQDVATAAPRVEEIERSLRRLLQRYRRAESLGIRSDYFDDLDLGSSLLVHRIQDLLDEETALLEYHLGLERSFLWVVEHDTVRSFELPNRQTLDAEARWAYKLLAGSFQRRSRIATRNALCRLSDVLIAPALSDLEAQRLLIASEAALDYLPFAAIPLPGQCDAEASSRTSGPAPLGSVHEVVSIPSATVLGVLRDIAKTPAESHREVLIVADPIPTETHLADDLQHFERLTHSKEEAETILEAAPGDRSLVLYGDDATHERLFESQPENYRVLHFATHGELNTEHPELSRLLLTATRDSTGRWTQSLFAHEIDDLDLTADLVVLSACETALGTEIRGEGLIGLPQAFMVAGAAAVLVSLWKIDDESTGKLMQEFYRNLYRESQDPAIALANAQRSLYEQHPEPYYWAGFSLLGDWTQFGLGSSDP